MTTNSDSFSKWFKSFPLEDTDNAGTSTTRRDLDPTGYEILKEIKDEMLEIKTDCSNKFENIDSEIRDIKEKNIPEENYFKVAGILNSTSLYVIIISPIVIILSTFIIYSCYSDNEKIYDYVLAAIGLIGIGGIIQVTKAYYQIGSITNRLKKIEEELKK